TRDRLAGEQQVALDVGGVRRVRIPRLHRQPARGGDLGGAAAGRRGGADGARLDALRGRRRLLEGDREGRRLRRAAAEREDLQLARDRAAVRRSEERRGGEEG